MLKNNSDVRSKSNEKMQQIGKEKNGKIEMNKRRKENERKSNRLDDHRSLAHS